MGCSMLVGIYRASDGTARFAWFHCLNDGKIFMGDIESPIARLELAARGK